MAMEGRYFAVACHAIEYYVAMLKLSLLLDNSLKMMSEKGSAQ